MQAGARSHDGAADVEFTTVCGQGHTLAERTDDSAINFITWGTGLAQS
jgi:hypothetical protein